MNELSLIELEDNPFPYKELQCVLGAYFRPSILAHQGWQSIADEIVNYCTVSCVQKIIRQIDTLLGNPVIDDRRLVLWIKRYATTWTCRDTTEARTSLKQLQDHLQRSLKQQRAVTMASLSKRASYA